MKVHFFAFLVYLSIASTTTNDVTKHSNWHLIDHEMCGESLSDRIIGGTEASIGQYPWVVRIGYVKMRYFNQKTTFKCGGSLINNVYVVTAAHCVKGLAQGEFIAVIRVGELNEKTVVDCQNGVCAPPVQDRKPVKIIPHQNYSAKKMVDDIALIRLEKPVNLNSFVNTICLPQGPLLTKNHVDEIMEVAGWGVTNNQEKRKTSPVLLHVRVPIVSNKRCEDIIGKSMGAGQLCAGGQIGFDSCGGDSGGPLMKPEAINGPPKYFLIGVVSFGSVTCGSDAPAIYSNVANYMTWLLDHMEP